jgi:hypothetical protein
MDRFPPPWRSEKVPNGYAVRDAAGKIVARIFGGVDLTMDEAKEIALTIAKAGASLVGGGARKG